MAIEDIKSLVEGTEVSEEVAKKMHELLEAKISEINDRNKIEIAMIRQEHEEEIEALKEHAQEYGDHIKEEYERAIETLKEDANAYGEYVKEEVEKEAEAKLEELAEKLDSYTQYVVEGFIESHKKEFVEQRDYKVMREAFERFKSILAENEITISVDGEVKKLRDEINEKKVAYDEIFRKFTDLQEKVAVLENDVIFESKTRDLADTQKERLKKLIESVSPDSKAEYERTLDLMIEEIVEDSNAGGDVGATSEGKGTHQSRKYETSIFPPRTVEFKDRMNLYLNHL